MSYIKDVDLPRHAWDTPPFLLIVSPTPPIQSVDAYVRTYVRMYVRTLGQSRDNQTKRGWPYSMGMGLCPTRASRAREPRYKFVLSHFNNQGHPTIGFCKISWRSKCCLEFSIVLGQFKICRWLFHSCTIFEVYLFPTINSLHFTAQVRLFFRTKEKPKIFGFKNVKEREIRKIITFVIR